MKLKRPYYRIKILGAMPESLVNAARTAGLELNDLNMPEAYCITADIKAEDKERLYALARKCMCEVSIIGSFDPRTRLKRRYTLLICMFAAAMLLCISGLFVWDIEIVGNKSISDAVILRQLRAAGLDVGTCRLFVDTDLLRAAVLPEIKELSWMSINIRGSRAKVTVTECAAKPEIYNENERTDIYSSCSGVIKQLSVLNGVPVVAERQAVSKGELLVLGAADSLSGEPCGVHALAEVKAYTWREIMSAAPAETMLKSSRGVEYDRFAVIFGKNRINFYIGGRNNIDECGKIVYEYKIGVKGVFCLPIRIVREHISPYSLAPAYNDAAEIMGERLAEELRNNTVGEVQTLNLTYSKHDGLVCAILRAQCLENIAEERQQSLKGKPYD